MSKRKLSTLGDQKPQFLKVTLKQTGNNLFHGVTVPIGTGRFAAGKNQAVVLEILKIFYSWLNVEIGAADTIIQLSVSTSDLAGLSTNEQILQSGRTLDFWTHQDIFATSVGHYTFEYPVIHNLTDGAGNGVLVAGDNIELALASSGFSQTNTCVIEILYRYTSVGLEEFLGILAGQTAHNE